MAAADHDLPDAARAAAGPRVSILMPVFNGARYIARSIDSILSQTFADLELIVCDDGSTDETAAILATYRDPRLVVLRNPGNIGVVASRNRAFAASRGEYVGLLDADDLARPNRIAAQVAYLDAHAECVLIAAAMHDLRDGELEEPAHPPQATPRVIAWVLLLANQIVASSILFRAATVRAMGHFMTEAFLYAEDYEFYHRIAALGQIARLDEKLVIYRRHAGNMSAANAALMTERAGRVLAQAYGPLFGEGAAEAARLVAQHIAAVQPVTAAADWRRLAEVFGAVTRRALEDPQATQAEREAIASHAALLWGRAVQVSAAAGRLGAGLLLGTHPPGCAPPPRLIARVLAGRLPLLSSLLRQAAARRASDHDTKDAGPQAGHSAGAAPASAAVHLLGARYHPLPADPDRVPRLYVIVDTEAEFDWSEGFARDLTAVNAMQRIGTAQAIFDRYGLHPVYFIDYPVAAQPEGYGPLREILAAGRCEIGVHLHPWTTPPFEELVSGYTSFAGNLDPRLEARKIAVMIETIERNLGVTPAFYRAGRYGVGPNTAENLAALGLPVDFSLLPGADLRDRGGPDFSEVGTCTYAIGDTGVISVPMSRAVVGGLPGLARFAERSERLPLMSALRLTAIFARLHLADTITLTPEGVTLDEQIRLIKALHRRGQRDFVLHYHSPTLAPGNTPYARDEGEVAEVLARLDGVCRYFFEELGGLPGFPRDLLRQAGAQRPRTAPTGQA